MDKKLDKKINSNTVKKEKDLYIESIVNMMKSMGEFEKRRIYKLTLHIYNKNQ